VNEEALAHWGAVAPTTEEVINLAQLGTFQK
jgi:hypothetical protein